MDVDHWYYAQFEPVMLEAAFFLLRHNETLLADPRATVRQLMKLIAYWDESSPPQGNPEGLLNGHWCARRRRRPNAGAPSTRPRRAGVRVRFVALVNSSGTVQKNPLGTAPNSRQENPQAQIRLIRLKHPTNKTKRIDRFDENFTNGTNPDDWVSSLDIVQQWYDSGKKPVNYGQCWVFGCLGRTLTASLGLVSRQVCPTRHSLRPPLPTRRHSSGPHLTARGLRRSPGVGVCDDGGRLGDAVHQRH